MGAGIVSLFLATQAIAGVGMAFNRTDSTATGFPFR